MDTALEQSVLEELVATVGDAVRTDPVTCENFKLHASSVTCVTRHGYPLLTHLMQCPSESTGQIRLEFDIAMY